MREINIYLIKLKIKNVDFFHHLKQYISYNLQIGDFMFSKYRTHKWSHDSLFVLQNLYEFHFTKDLNLYSRKK